MEQAQELVKTSTEIISTLRSLVPDAYDRAMEELHLSQAIADVKKAGYLVIHNDDILVTENGIKLKLKES